MQSNSVCSNTSDLHNWTTVKRESDLLITSKVIDRIGRQEVLLPINHNSYNFQKQQIHSGQISMVETMSKIKNFHFGNSSIFFQDKWLLLWLL